MDSESSFEELIKQLACSQFIFTGITKNVGPTIASASLPTVYLTKLQFDEQRIFRGFHSVNLRDTDLQYMYRTEGNHEPLIRERARYVAAGRFSEGRALLLLLEQADGEKTQLVMEIASIPAGWIKVRGNGWESPFPRYAREPTWYKDDRYKHYVKCAATGRPALLVSERINLVAEPIVSPDYNESMSTFGDGKFRITVMNNSQKDEIVDALLNHCGKISWHDSLIIIDANSKRVWTLPSDEVYDNLEPTVLKSGETCTTVIDALTLPGDVYWQTDNTRVDLLFCLGQLCSASFFHYNAAIHSAMHKNAIGRDAVLECS